jgi:O-antigen/teichoic acid export membrane protein
MFIQKTINKYIYSDNERDIHIKKNVIFSFFVKIASILVNLLHVPLLINSLNVTNYGIWLTLTSIISWLSFFDVGIGHGLRNKIAETLANKNISLARIYISTSYSVLLVIIVLILCVIYFIIPQINWSLILNTPENMSDELELLVIIILSFFCIQLLLKLLDSILFALQKAALPPFLHFLSQATSLIVIFFMNKSGKEFNLIHYASVISIIPVFILFFATLIFFKKYKKEISPKFKCIKLSYAKDILGIGSQFFLIQLTSIALFQTNNFIIAYKINPVSVVEYNIAYKYYSVLPMIFSIITMPIWSATTDAFFQQDYKWIKSTIQKLNRLYIYALAIAMLMLIFSSLVYQIWIGNKVNISFSISVLVLFYHLINIKTGIYCAFLNGIGKIRLQFYLTLLEAIIHIPLAFTLSNFWGVNGVLISMCFVSILNLIWEPIQLNKLINGKATGLWEK